MFSREVDVFVTYGRICDVTFKCDAELRLRGVTLEDVRSFLRDTQRFDLAVRTETIKYWDVSAEIWELNSYGCVFSVPNPRGPLKSLFGFAVQKRCPWVRV